MEELSGLEQIVINYSSSPKTIYETRRWKWEERHIGLAATRGRSTGVGLSLSLTVIAAPVIFPPTSRHLSLSLPPLFSHPFSSLFLCLSALSTFSRCLSHSAPPPPPPPLLSISVSSLSHSVGKRQSQKGS